MVEILALGRIIIFTNRSIAYTIFKIEINGVLISKSKSFRSKEQISSKTVDVFIKDGIIADIKKEITVSSKVKISLHRMLTYHLDG